MTGHSLRWLPGSTKRFACADKKLSVVFPHPGWVFRESIGRTGPMGPGGSMETRRLVLAESRGHTRYANPKQRVPIPGSAGIPGISDAPISNTDTAKRARPARRNRALGSADFEGFKWSGRRDLNPRHLAWKAHWDLDFKTIERCMVSWHGKSRAGGHRNRRPDLVGERK